MFHSSVELQSTPPILALPSASGLLNSETKLIILNAGGISFISAGEVDPLKDNQKRGGKHDDNVTKFGRRTPHKLEFVDKSKH